MSEDTAVVAPVSAPVAEAAPTPPPSPLKGRAALKERLTKSANVVMDSAAESQKFKVEVPTTPASETTNPETVTEAVADLKQAGVEVPDQKKTETNGQYATKIAQLMLAVQRSEADSLKHKGELQKVSAERDDLKARLADASSDPVKALKLANMTPDELAQAMLDGKLTKAEAAVVKQELPDEVKELIEEGKRLKAEKQAATEKAEAEETRKKKIGIVDTAKKGVLEQYPALELVSSDRLLAAYEQITEANGEEPDFGEFSAQMQKNIVAEVATAVAHAGTFRAILKEKPELKEILLKELGISTAAPVVEATPVAVEEPKRTSIGGVVNETSGKKKDMSIAERKARAAAAAGKIFG